MTRLGRSMFYARRALRCLWWTVRALFERSRLPDESVASTADWHSVPGHPSLLCKCGDVGPDEHQPGCEWRAKMCRACDGNGWCGECHGDGIGAHAETADGE